MPQSYPSPGVYVHEVPSAIRPIAGVGTSTVGFIGLLTDSGPPGFNEVQSIAQGRAWTAGSFTLSLGSATATTKGIPYKATADQVQAELVALDSIGDGNVVCEGGPLPAAPITVAFQKAFAYQDVPQLEVDASSLKGPSASVNVTTTREGGPGSNEIQAITEGETWTGGSFTLSLDKQTTSPIPYDATAAAVQAALEAVDSIGAGNVVCAGGPLPLVPVTVTFQNKLGGKDVAELTADASSLTGPSPTVNVATVTEGSSALAKQGEVRLCTTFSDFKASFGDFSQADDGQNTLAHAVYGFFNNGGTRCYVAWGKDEGDVESALASFETIDEIAIVAAPGLGRDVQTDLVDHCEKMEDRLAVLDAPDALDPTAATDGSLPANSPYAALYLPWIQVFDPASDALKFVPPSGHVAGIYARVDAERGVHKAPANEVVLGALSPRYRISKSQQAGLNPQGVNCIRDLNGDIRVWGARTLGGDANEEWKYVNVRRTFLFIKKSIAEGTQWVVFEPNDASLWAKITRNVTNFLTNVWRDGALFGATAQEAFYVKCDEETNPPEVREAGQVVTEIGVAIVEPAEFVVFNLSQMAGTAASS